MVPRRDVLRTALLGAVAWAVAACGVRTPTVEPSPLPSPTEAPPSPSPSPEPSATQATPGLTLRDKVAGLLVVGFRGMTLDEAPWLRSALEDGGLGGVILFDRDTLTGADRNVVSPEQLTGLISDLKAAAGDREIIVAVDQEGGRVTRLSPAHGFPAVASEAEIGAGTIEAAQAWASGLAATLADAGINLNLAPVVDLEVNPDSPAIGALDRSFSVDPNVVVEMATIEINALHADAVGSAIKHFPGIGSSTTNTDFGVADVTTTWTRTELEPFARLIAAGEADVVMVGHVVNGQLDPDRPASLSRPTVTALLRVELGWTGPVITDDLQAGAIDAHFGLDEAILLALEAGNDILLFANTQTYDEGIVEAVIDVISDAVAAGRVSEDHVNVAWERVQSLLRSLAAGRGD